MYRFEIMDATHLEEVAKIEKDTFKEAWGYKDFAEDIERGDNAFYVVILNHENVVAGYCGMWIIDDFGDITKIALKKELRGLGLGNYLMQALIRIGDLKKLRGLTLEVRQSNTSARKLYEKHGFIKEGLRKGYYQDNNEDAIIMWKYF